MVRSDDGIRMTFEVALTNIGKGPATNVEIWTPMACGAGAASPLEARAMVPDYGAGRTMFPDEPIVQLCGAVLKQGQINAASDQSRMFNRIAVGVLVSVKYKFAGGIGKTTQFYNLIDEHILEQIEMSDLPTTDKISLRRVYTQDTAS
jgi:hypothetical protein